MNDRIITIMDAKQARNTITPTAVADAMKRRAKEVPDGSDIMDEINNVVRGIFDVADHAFSLTKGVSDENRHGHNSGTM